MTDRLVDLHRILSNRLFQEAPDEGRRRAAVAVILCDLPEGFSLLFIERARVDNDPWSGHIAFPGGAAEKTDPSPRGTAERETREEIGLDLGQGLYLGRLDDVSGLLLPVQVSGHVYAVSLQPALVLGPEVRTAFWMSADALRDPERQVQQTFEFMGQSRSWPALDLLGPGHPLLWGITYAFVIQLLDLMNDRHP